ncbi:MAG TPA: ABC transporter substrate-binding protein [Hyphomicrobiales bacterium]|nr:ABC transporter substrate-binding protein [Hyphomicrobiales bacterium]
MQPTRRSVVLSSAAALAAGAAGLRPSFAAAEPFKIGWPVTLTGPGSAPGLSFDLGVRYAVDRLNAKGGAGGHRIELVTRDTQGDPTKAVNIVQELISSEKVSAIFGPTNSGEALAITPIMARFGVPNVHAGTIDSLIDPVKYPNAFRIAPAGKQWDAALRHYVLAVRKWKKVGILGDTTGYGTTAVSDSVAGFKKDGGEVVYSATIDQTQADVTPQLLSMRKAGAEAIVVWSVSSGLEARIMNTRAQLGWDSPILGHPTMGSNDVRKLLDKPSNFDKVYVVGFRSCTRDASGKLPARTQAFIDEVRGKMDLKRAILFLVLIGVDGIDLLAKAVAETGSTSRKAIIDYLNTVKDFPGLFGTYSFSPTDHDGYQTTEVVMCAADSLKDGALAQAPGYD